MGETDTRRPHYATSACLVEPVSRKHTCKVGPGRFIPQCRRIKIGLVMVSILNKINAHNYFVFYSCIVTTHKPGSDTTVGERSRNSKFSYVSPRSIYGETSNEGKESASTYPCRSLSGSVQENGVEGVVLVVIQITGDPSAERTAPPRSTHEIGRASCRERV